MPRVQVRCYAELNDHLREELRGVEFPLECPAGSDPEGLLAMLGVPPGEVDLILVNGESAGLRRPVADGDRVSLFPVFESFDISGLGRVRERPLRDPRFVLDVHLGKLAHLLRMLGFDTLYRSDYADAELVRVSGAEERALLTKDRELLGSQGVTRGFLIRSQDPRGQLAEVLRRFDLYSAARPFTRCIECNARLVPVEKAAVAGRLPERVRERYDEYWLCAGCDRVYWRGTHFARMAQYVEEVLRSPRE